MKIIYFDTPFAKPYFSMLFKLWRGEKKYRTLLWFNFAQNSALCFYCFKKGKIKILDQCWKGFSGLFLSLSLHPGFLLVSFTSGKLLSSTGEGCRVCAVVPAERLALR